MKALSLSVWTITLVKNIALDTRLPNSKKKTGQRDSVGRVWGTKEYFNKYSVKPGQYVAIDSPSRPNKHYRIHLPRYSPPEQSIEGEEQLSQEGGAVSLIRVNRYERDQKNRKNAIRKHGFSCFGCGLTMADKYGEIAEGFIHIHHTIPLSKAKQGTPDINNLIPLCPNCHSVVHLKNPPLSLEELQKRTGYSSGDN